MNPDPDINGDTSMPADSSTSPSSLPGYLSWEQDLEMVSRFIDKKAELEQSYQQYMSNNPELTAVLADFMQAVLIHKPDDVYVFAQEFFAPFAQNSEPQSYYPVMQATVYGVEIPTRCFVGGLPYSMTEFELNNFFSQFGLVKDSKIITDRNGVSKGYGFVTYQTEQEAAEVCAKGSLYYKEKKLNISKAIRRQGGQYTKANQEYVNGQRMLYQSADGYLLAQNNGSWIVEEPSPFCQPAKPCFQILPSPPVFMGGPNPAPYIQPPVTPTYYSAIPPASMTHPYEPLPPDPGPLLYCDVIDIPPPQQHVITHVQTQLAVGVTPPPDTEPPPHAEEVVPSASGTSSDGGSSCSTISATTSVSSTSLDQDMAKCSLSTTDQVPEQMQEVAKSPAQPPHKSSTSRPVKSRPPNLPCPPQPTPAGPVYPPQNYYITYQCTT